MSKICPKCNEHYDDSDMFCLNPECGGARLVPNKEGNDPALNLGDANAISGGVSINQSKNISTQETHYHSTTVERVKSESELKLEATNQLRAKAEEIMAERGRIDSVAMGQLRPLALQLGIDEETFKTIIKDVRSNRNGVASGLRAADARYLQQAQQAVQTNDMDGLSNLTHRLEAMAAISQDENVQYLYYLSYALQYPIKSMEVYERQTDENYWRTFWAIVSYIRTGKYSEADKVLPRFDPQRYEKSEEDRNLLEAYNLIMRDNKDGAQEFLDEILGEPTEQVKPLLRAVESKLYEEEPESLEVRFYMERVMSTSDVVVKSQKKVDVPTSSEEPTKKESNPEAQDYNKNKEAEELYSKACAASGAKRVMLLQKASDAGSLEAMYDLSDCYFDGEGVEKNMPLSIKWITKAADAGYTKAQTALGTAYYQGIEGLDQNYALSEKYLLMAAKKENTDAQAYLSALYVVMEEYDKAMVWARKAAQMEHPKACFMLGRIYDEGLGVDVNQIEGLKWFEKAANNGDADAQNIVGNIYLNADYVEHDPKKALSYYQKAASQGHLYGMANFGYCYQEGIGTGKDLIAAEKWIRKAAEGGLQDAIDILNTNPLYNKNLKEKKKALTEDEAKALYDAVDTNSDPSKIKVLQKLAEAGDVWAMFYYARLHTMSNSVKRNYELAVDYFIKAANAGNAPAMNSLAQRYLRGEGVIQNSTEAIKWYRKSADAGNSLAMQNLGFCYINGNGVAQSNTEAVKWFRKAAELGNAQAMCNLGIGYANGDGVAQSNTEAVKWFRKAAELGNAQAMYNLGIGYANGDGVAQSNTEAVKWFRKAAELGNAQAMYNLGIGYAIGLGINQNYTEAMRWYLKATDSGNEDAFYEIGVLYYNGLGVRQDHTEAIKWYRKAADAGNVDAMCNLGDCYENGRGVNQDYTEAARWYRKAADAGNAMAMNNLGDCYRLGKGVNQDYTEAARWYRKAADAGNAWAMGQIGIFYESGKGVNQNYVEAAKWYRKAADAGNAWAMGQIGIFYENGKGVNQNYAEAAKWYRKGADAGDSNAMFGLGNCYINGKGVIQDDNEGLNYFCMGAESGNLLSMTNVGWCYEFGRGTEANPVEAMKWYQKALDNGYQMDDWLSQRMEECKLKMPSNVEVIFNTAWTTAPNDINTDKWNIYLHLHFQINHCNNRKLYIRFTTELSNDNNDSTGIILSIIDDECIPNYDFCEWKDYIHWINEGVQNWPNNESNMRLKTTIQVMDEYKNPLTTNSYWITYNVIHKIRLFHDNELYLA